MTYNIEDITEQDAAWDEYSVMMGMEVFTVTVEDGEEYEVYDSDGKVVEGNEAYKMIDAVRKCRAKLSSLS